MKYIYLIYYIRVNAGNTVGHGNKFIELEHKIIKKDIEDILNSLDEEDGEFVDIRVKYSKSFIVNIMPLN